ncbi:hypothetical protein ISU10_21080 [Nocardioides agariphilus]|uniref:Uncharacterized protein n=1 Tax=Nocardioides agariphilus TaxID=433664 RepID=A0A930YKD5_9ACTN|nr:hypothetical protein [Nocardioides agariphilus]MBF4770277.1 hypothetical protein [Nocardioides agariphilus]
MSAAHSGDDRETLQDIEAARRVFETHISEPDPNSKRPKIGSVTATKKGTRETAGDLSFGVSVDAEENIVVRTTQFTTHEPFKRQHVALLLASDLREHYEVEVLHPSGMEPTPEGSKVIASLQRRGIMASDEGKGEMHSRFEDRGPDE